MFVQNFIFFDNIFILPVKIMLGNYAVSLLTQLSLVAIWFVQITNQSVIEVTLDVFLRNSGQWRIARFLLYFNISVMLGHILGERGQLNKD